MTQLVLASTLYGAATVAAMIESGTLSGRQRRVLVTANTTHVPELATPIEQQPAFAAIAHHFEDIYSYNEAIAPHHPSEWQPRSGDAELLERYFRTRWDLGEEPVEIVAESIQVPPALALVTSFAASRITLYADGLMAYGPTRTSVGASVGDRVRAVVHPDLIPGLRPALLREYEVPSRAFDACALRAVFERMAPTSTTAAVCAAGAALVVGQFLSALHILDPLDELALHKRIVDAAVLAGAERVLFKAHPSAPASTSNSLALWAAGEGIDLRVAPALTPLETILASSPPQFVVGCFSTALITAPGLYGIPAASVGVDDILRRLHPYENSNRIPATIVGEVLPDLEIARSAPSLPLLDAEATEVRLQPLVDTVSYCMQPLRLAGERAASVSWLGDHVDGPARRYFTGKRLTALGLPGGAPVPLARQVAGPALRWSRRRRAGGVALARRARSYVESRMP